ncbi:tyrosine-type recombinase/integrase [Methylobacterium oxalidis]|uniref:Integrase n=1 Tax=Methylobacterium oxalidis TaxID=944322 RepID=A0A512J4P8_9HYPH|nr:tyrosine-type recombinase/integrase [Methylobacterium oxalidis]GEP04935.1 integrase [Methylobacterium oxalidis]GJE35159.1 Prophage integrase IntA [Methylobacterium oxalidis]GLS63672.1 integrase [Methylobacterium oxalidis]
MPKLRLTHAAVERLRLPSKGQVDHFDSHLPAFGLRASYLGAKAYFVMTRVDGRLVRITIGRHPALSLADAREKARQLILHAKAGQDPRQIEAEARRKKEHKRRTTFGGAVALFMERYVERNLRPNTAREYRRTLQGPDTRDWQDRPLSSLMKAEVLEVLHRIEGRGSPAAANRALAYLSKFFNWCLEQDLLTVSPASRVRPLSATRSRDRVLQPDELVWIWWALSEWPSQFGSLFKLLLLTGQRRSEVAGMRWDELRSFGTEEAIWSLPASRTKNGQPHLVPLAEASQNIIASLPREGPFVFTTRGTTGLSGFSKAKTELDQRVNALRAGAALPSLPPWTLHDLRRTMVTLMNEQLGIAPHVVEAVVNHVSGSAKRGVAGVYNRALYLRERRDALCAWSRWVTRHDRQRPEAAAGPAPA